MLDTVQLPFASFRVRDVGDDDKFQLVWICSSFLTLRRRRVPAASAFLTTWEPIKPVAPVMKVVGDDIVCVMCCSVREDSIWNGEKIGGKICVSAVLETSTG